MNIIIFIKWYSDQLFTMYIACTWSLIIFLDWVDGFDIYTILCWCVTWRRSNLFYSTLILNISKGQNYYTKFNQWNMFRPMTLFNMFIPTFSGSFLSCRYAQILMIINSTISPTTVNNTALLLISNLEKTELKSMVFGGT
jgi:hypothetical protein